MCWVPTLPTALATPCHTPHRVVSYSCCPLSRHNDSFPTVCHRPTSWKTFETPTPRSGAWACPASSPLSWDDSVVGETGEKFLLSEPHALHCSSLKRWSSPPNPAICGIWDRKNFFLSMCCVAACSGPTPLLSRGLGGENFLLRKFSPCAGWPPSPQHWQRPATRHIVWCHTVVAH